MAQCCLSAKFLVFFVLSFEIFVVKLLNITTKVSKDFNKSTKVGIEKQP